MKKYGQDVWISVNIRVQRARLWVTPEGDILLKIVQVKSA